MAKDKLKTKYYGIVRSIYDCIEPQNTYVADSTVKTLASIAFFYVGMNKDINECINNTANVLENILKAFTNRIKSFDSFDNVLKHYEENEIYERFVDIYIENLENYYFEQSKS